MKWDWGSRRPARIGDHRMVLEWTKADQEAFARSVLRRRWLNAMHREGVVTVAQLRAFSEEQLCEIPNLGPMSVADISAALGDPAFALG
jgi:DNA-directed RNA polymerase alpha subunit